MRPAEIAQLIDGTTDPAFAVDGLGCIAAWNSAAAGTLGIDPADAIGRPCYKVVRGTDDNGEICSRNCMVLRAAKHRQPVGNFDLRIDTPKGKEWFNVTAIIADVNGSKRPYTVHILRFVDLYKRLEVLLRDFVLNKTNIPPENVNEIFSSATTAGRDAGLTNREIEILHSLEKGSSSAAIGKVLGISPATVDNHIQHILKKLSAHSRVEAVLRAEHAGLL